MIDLLIYWFDWHIPLHIALILSVLINIACLAVGSYFGFVASIRSFKRIMTNVGMIEEFEKRIDLLYKLKKGDTRHE